MSFRTFYYQARYIQRTALDVAKHLLGQNQTQKKLAWQRLGFLSPDYHISQGEEKSIWIEALSGGEVCRLHSFTRKLKNEFPDKKIFLSSSNMDALGLARKNKYIDHVFMTPFELTNAVNRVIQSIKPEILIVVDLALFPILVRQARRKNVKTVLVGAFMSKNYWATVHMKRAMAWQSYKYFDFIGCAGDGDKENFIKMGADPSLAKITGSLQYDIDFLTVDEAEKQNLRRQLILNNDDFVIVAGSIRRREEEILIKGYLRAKLTIPSLKLILVPRFLEDVQYIEEKAADLNVATVRRSKLASHASHDGIVVVDTFGELAKLYAVAHIVFIGASLVCNDPTRLTHNVIEPLIQCVPIFFGPYYSSLNVLSEKVITDKWSNILNDFKKIWEGLEIKDEKDFAQGLVYLWSHPEIVQKIRDKCATILGANKGNIQKNVRLVTEMLNS